MSRWTLAVAACAVATSVAATARAAPPTRAFEVTVHTGYTFMLNGGRERKGEISRWNGGGTLAFGLLFRSGYFLSPFLDVGYHPLFRGARRVDLAEAGGHALVSSDLAATGFMAGPALDVWRLRLKGGIGFYDVRVRSTVLGRTATPHELDMGYMASVSGLVLRGGRLRVGLEARVGAIVEADVVFLSAGVSLGGDAVTF